MDVTIGGYYDNSAKQQKNLTKKLPMRHKQNLKTHETKQNLKTHETNQNPENLWNQTKLNKTHEMEKLN